MSDNASTREIIERLAANAGVKKKLATELMRVIPEIIEEGLMADGEVRVKGLGTFRLKWTQARPGRNPKTGEPVTIPPHSRLVFLPEQSLKEYINRDSRLLDYKAIPAMEPEKPEIRAIPDYQFDEAPVMAEMPEPVPEESPETLSEQAVPEEIDYSYEPEPEIPVRRRRIHWIIPTVIAIIAVLSVAFYFRNCNPLLKETRILPSLPEEKRKGAYIVTKDSVKPGDNAVADTATAPVETEKKPSAPIATTTNPDGVHLFQLARVHYGNPFLWVLIYRENIDKIPNPDVVVTGKELVIPRLEGQPRKLSHADSLHVADGYRLVYEYYLGKGSPKAEEFRQAYERYQPAH